MSGRIKHFLSAFGEHVIAEEVENSMKIATKDHGVTIREFTVAPNINPKEGLPCHEWYIEFETQPKDINAFSKTLETEMLNQNIYYKDLIYFLFLTFLLIYLLFEINIEYLGQHN